MADRAKITKEELKQLQEVAGRNIIDGFPLGAQKIQQLVQRSEIVDKESK